ncbi:MAG: substrate-binding domain-containing protein [Caulobacteraceae bacterium]|nr:substrate-binding domain-containing protein [Caulobacter sp.]
MARLAELAGVAKVTVSRALNDSGAVHGETRSRILTLAAEHGYVINQAARSLSLKRSHMIAVVVDMEEGDARPEAEPYPLELLAGLADRADVEGYAITLTTRRRWAEARARGLDAAVLLGQGANGAAALLSRAGLPLVVWGADDGSGRLFVGGDDHAGGGVAARRLLELGRRRLAFVGDAHHPELAARRAGFEAAARAGGASAFSLSCGFSFAAGFAAGAELLRLGGIDGVLCGAGDVCAMGMVRALLEAGAAVPDAVSVIGYDDALMAASFVPALTTVRQDWRGGGALLAEKVLALIEGRAVRSETLPVELRVRAT